MGALSARQWGCQAWLLLSESSSRASPQAGIFQSNRRLLSGASWLCNAISRDRGQAARCMLWALPCRHALQPPGPAAHPRHQHRRNAQLQAGPHGYDKLKRSGCSSFPGILACASCSCCFGLSDAGVSVFPPTRGAQRAPGLWPVEQTSVMSIGEPRPPQPVLWASDPGSCSCVLPLIRLLQWFLSLEWSHKDKYFWLMPVVQLWHCIV